jgi:hypothetical protein
MKRKRPASIDILIAAHASLAREADRPVDRAPMDACATLEMCTLGLTLTSEPPPMPAKKGRGRPNVLTDLTAHIEASRMAHEWAEKSLGYRAAGNTKQADSAESKAKYWLSKAIKIESVHAALRQMPTTIKPRRR